MRNGLLSMLENLLASRSSARNSRFSFSATNFLIRKPKAKETIRAYWVDYGISKTTRTRLKMRPRNTKVMMQVSKLEITIEYCIP